MDWSLKAVDMENYDFHALAENEARKRDCEVIIPAINQVQLDIDSDSQMAYFENRLEFFIDKAGGYTLQGAPEIHASKSGLPHRHITITFNEPVSEEARILIQLALGSDPVRERMNAMRLLCGVENPTRLFKPLPYPEFMDEFGNFVQPL